jgi:hypothetical protein
LHGIHQKLQILYLESIPIYNNFFWLSTSFFRLGAVQSFAAGETVADVSHARLLSKSAGSEHRWHGGPVGDALGEAGGVIAFAHPASDRQFHVVGC